MLPFSRDDFLAIFGAYNDAIWPAQPFAYVLAFIVLTALLRRDSLHQRLALALIGLMWLWTGIAYHWLFFSEINPAATGFGLMFVVQGLLLNWLAVRGELTLQFRWRSDAAGYGGAALIVYAAIVYPLIDLLQGHWPRMPWFGISPCPVTLFTLGFLMLARPRAPLWLWLVPVAWSLIGGAAAFMLTIPQDWVLLASGPAAALVAYRGSFSPRIMAGSAAIEGRPS